MPPETAGASRAAGSCAQFRGHCCSACLSPYVRGRTDEDILSPDLTRRTNKYLNTMIEQDHRRVKQRVRSMVGFECFAHAMVTISGIERTHQIKKNNSTSRRSTSLPHELRRSGRQCWLRDDNSMHTFSSSIYSLHHNPAGYGRWPRAKKAVTVWCNSP